MPPAWAHARRGEQQIVLRAGCLESQRETEHVRRWRGESGGAGKRTILTSVPGSSSHGMAPASGRGSRPLDYRIGEDSARVDWLAVTQSRHGVEYDGQCGAGNPAPPRWWPRTRPSHCRKIDSTPSTHWLGDLDAVCVPPGISRWVRVHHASDAARVRTVMSSFLLQCTVTGRTHQVPNASRCTRRSPVSSGWKVEITTLSSRHSTAVGPSGDSICASTSTPSPTRSMTGARMNILMLAHAEGLSRAAARHPAGAGHPGRPAPRRPRGGPPAGASPGRRRGGPSRSSLASRQCNPLRRPQPPIDGPVDVAAFAAGRDRLIDSKAAPGMADGGSPARLPPRCPHHRLIPHLASPTSASSPPPADHASTQTQDQLRDILRRRPCSRRSCGGP
jgi:hypothetical protein